MIARQPIVEALAGLGFRRVEGLAELSRVDDRLSYAPAAFVCPESESAEPNRLATGAHDQRVTARWMVVIVVQIGIGAHTADDELEALAGAVKGALAGWTHPDASGPTGYLGGRLIRAPKGYLAWRCDFSTPARLRKLT